MEVLHTYSKSYIIYCKIQKNGSFFLLSSSSSRHHFFATFIFCILLVMCVLSATFILCSYVGM